jgi:hypothetical protein
MEYQPREARLHVPDEKKHPVGHPSRSHESALEQTQLAANVGSWEFAILKKQTSPSTITWQNNLHLLRMNAEFCL